MTYRVRDHSSSDNPSLYRVEDERNECKTKKDPIKSLTEFVRSIGVKDLPEEKGKAQRCKKDSYWSLSQMPRAKLPSILSMFDDEVYNRLPAHLQRAKGITQISFANGDKYTFLNKFDKSWLWSLYVVSLPNLRNRFVKMYCTKATSSES